MGGPILHCKRKKKLRNLRICAQSQNAKKKQVQILHVADFPLRCFRTLRKRWEAEPQQPAAAELDRRAVAAVAAAAVLQGRRPIEADRPAARRPQGREARAGGTRHDRRLDRSRRAVLRRLPRGECVDPGGNGEVRPLRGQAQRARRRGARGARGTGRAQMMRLPPSPRLRRASHGDATTGGECAAVVAAPRAARTHPDRGCAWSRGILPRKGSSGRDVPTP